MAAEWCGSRCQAFRERLTLTLIHLTALTFVITMPLFLWRLGLVGAAILVASSSPALATGVTVQRHGDAYIVQDAGAGAWTVGSGGAALTLALDPSRDFAAVSLTSASGQSWLQRQQSDTRVTVNGVAVVFGSRAHDFQYDTVTTSNDGPLLRLDASFVMRSAGLRLTQHITVAEGSPTFEVWTTFQALGGRPVAVANIEALHVLVPAGTVRWLSGREGDVGDESRDTAFMRRQADLRIGDTLGLGAEHRSSEQTVPWLAIDGAQDEFYAALMWSGPWSLTATRVSTGIDLAWGLKPMSTTVGVAAVEGPHVLFGVARGALPEATAAMRSYVMTGLRGDRPLTPLVTYNTWYAYGTQITDETLRLEIGRAAALGVELFVVDAGWYTGADQSDPANFDQGLGTWEVDPIRFPSGLKPLRDYAHRLGLKFGIWVEPSRVNLSVVGHGGPDESWLATTAGSYGSDHSAQICLGGAVGRQWIVDRLSALIDAAEPDYLKWDNNLWMNCDRDGHDHGPTDGSFAHVTALYQMLEALHRRYPDLLIENCSAGGNRLDFAMLRYTDVAWMDDRTAPSVHVRHNIQGLSEVFPPAYLLAFVTDHQGESLHDARDLTLYVRSRMIGALGLGFRGDELVADEVSRIGREIATYKDLRGRLSTAAATLLSAQAALADGPDWDVVQAAGPSGDALVVYAYYNGAGASSVTVKPTGLRPEASYAVISVDVGVIGVATGDALMSNGLEVLASAASAAHILTLTAIP